MFGRRVVLTRLFGKVYLMRAATEAEFADLLSMRTATELGDVRKLLSDLVSAGRMDKATAKKQMESAEGLTASGMAFEFRAKFV
jgi:hypothetical protein